MAVTPGPGLVLPRKGYFTLARLRLCGGECAANVGLLQRLFSMFPAGAAGFGLLILRLCAAGMLVRNAVLTSAPELPFSEAAALFVLVVLLCIGVFTPAACIAAGLAQITLLICAAHGDPFEVVSAVGVTSALLLLGPGAFSVDGRMFGRRRILPSDSR